MGKFSALLAMLMLVLTSCIIVPAGGHRGHHDHHHDYRGHHDGYRR